MTEYLTPKQMMVWGASLTFLLIIVFAVIEGVVGHHWWLTALGALVRTPFLLLAVYGFVLWNHEREVRRADRP